MEEKIKPEVLNIDLQEIELVKIDYTQYVGKKEQISDVQILKGKFGAYLQVTSSVIDAIQRGKDVFELRAKRNFTIHQDAEGKYGWGKDTELGLFLTAKRVKKPDDLKGKEVTIQVDNSKEGKQFLSFI